MRAAPGKGDRAGGTKTTMMVRFNELGVTRDGRFLIINVSVRDDEYLKDGDPKVYLDEVVVVNQDQYADGESYEEDYVYKIEYGDTETKTSDSIILSDEDVPGIKDDLLFVIVKTRGESGGAYNGENPSVGVTYWLEPLYSRFMDAMREIASSRDKECLPPRWMIDLHLRKRALEAAIESGDFALACKWWREFYIGQEPDIDSKCGCHG